MITHLRGAAELVRAGAWSDLWTVARSRWSSQSDSLGLRRDVRVPFPASAAKLAISVRPLRAADIPLLFEPHGDAQTGDAWRERSIRLRMAKAALGTCYVAVTKDDEPCFMEWLIGAEDRRTLLSLFGDRFPPFSPGEMLLEGAFTRERWRRQGVMAASVSLIAEQAALRGASSVITFVAAANHPSLKGCAKAGFAPYLRRTDRWRLFRRTSSFSPLIAPPDFLMGRNGQEDAVV